jgi:sarcosine oxidase, subunit gamma
LIRKEPVFVHDLLPQTALGRTTARRDSIGAVEILENPGLALASVAARHGQEKSCKTALGKMLRCTPPQAGRASTGESLSALWSGPDQWLVIAPFETHEMLTYQLKEILGATASVTEQTDGWVCFDLTGGTMLDIFERLCPLPVRRMKAGDGTRTTIHHLGCFVICREAGSAMRVLGPRSAAGSLHHALCTAARAIA